MTMNKQDEKQKKEEVVAEDILKENNSNVIEPTEVKEIQSEEVDWEDKYKRALADYQNLEKRSHEQRREWIMSSNKELLLRILPVLDTLILAQKHSEDQNLKVSVQQFLDVLKAEGIIKIEALGQEFDPH